MIKKGIVDIISSTDVGCQGMNFSFIDLIINVGAPKKIDTYLHRVGRIGRFKKKGYCFNLINKSEIEFISNFEKNTKIHINKSNLLVQ